MTNNNKKSVFDSGKSYLGLNNRSTLGNALFGSNPANKNQGNQVSKDFSKPVETRRDASFYERRTRSYHFPDDICSGDW